MYPSMDTQNAFFNYFLNKVDIERCDDSLFSIWFNLDFLFDKIQNP